MRIYIVAFVIVVYIERVLERYNRQAHVTPLRGSVTVVLSFASCEDISVFRLFRHLMGLRLIGH